MSNAPPLTGIRVLEFAGLAPGPFAGLLLADYGATVLRIDRAHPSAYTAGTPPPPTNDSLCRRKTSITVNTKTASGIALIQNLVRHVDVLIDPFRPGVLEKMGLGPDLVLLQINPRLIVARMTGFRRDGKYKDMAGHDINYIAVSGVLSMLGRADERPYAPGNLVGDFAGGGGVCFMGILMALIQRDKTGKGQVVEANMVDGSSYMASMPRFSRATPMWNGPRGTNVLDGGSPYYDTYKTKDGRYMAVGALEPQFFAALLKGLGISESEFGGKRDDKKTWAKQREMYTKRFKEKTRDEWERVFDGTDACCTPILTQDELQSDGFEQRPIVTLKETPGFRIAEGQSDGLGAEHGSGRGVEGGGWTTKGLRPGEGGEGVLTDWTGWKRGSQYDVKDGTLVLNDQNDKAKL